MNRYRGRQIHSVTRYSILFVVPLAYVASAAIALRDRFFQKTPASYWADPSYAYLLNGQTWLNGMQILHIDHPGTPVQVFNGLFQWLLWRTNLIGDSHALLEINVVNYSENYQFAMSAFLTAAQYSLIVLLAAVISRHFSLRYGLICEFFLTGLAISFTSVLISNQPEGFLFVFLLAALSFMLPVTLAEENRTRLYLSIVGMSIFLALAITAKISAIFIVLALPLGLRRVRDVAVTYLLTALSVLLILQPVWNMLPVAVRFWSASVERSDLGATSLWKNSWAVSDFISGIGTLGSLSVLFVASGFLISLIYLFTQGKVLPQVPSRIFMAGIACFLFATSIALIGQIIINPRGGTWHVPAIPIIATASTITIFVYLQFIVRVHFTIPRSAVTLFGVFALSMLARDLIERFPSSVAPNTTVNVIQEIEREWLAEGSLVVYDEIITWNSGYGGACVALIFGNGFANNPLGTQIEKKCPNQRIGRFGWPDRIDSFGNGSVSCRDLRAELKGGRSVALLTREGAVIPSFAKKVSVVKSGSTTFTIIDIPSCP